MGEIEGRHEELLNEAQLAAAAEEKEAHAFEVDPAQVRNFVLQQYSYAAFYLLFG